MMRKKNEKKRCRVIHENAVLSPVSKSILSKLGQAGFGTEKQLHWHTRPSCLIPCSHCVGQCGQFTLAEVACARLEAVATAPTLTGIFQVEQQVREQVVFAVVKPAEQNHIAR